MGRANTPELGYGGIRGLELKRRRGTASFLMPVQLEGDNSFNFRGHLFEEIDRPTNERVVLDLQNTAYTDHKALEFILASVERGLSDGRDTTVEFRNVHGYMEEALGAIGLWGAMETEQIAQAA